MYPQAHANFKLPQKLKVERTCEDKLLTLGLNMEADASLHFNIAEEHASDKRRLEARLRVVVSNDFQDSPWLQSRAARGNLGEAPLIKVKDMMGPASRIKSQPGGYRLNPGDRVTQRGIGAMSHLLRNLMSGLNFKAGDKLLFVQVNVGEFAEMPHAVLNMMLESQATPYVCLKGIYINKAGEMDASAPGLACYPSDGGRVLLSSHIPVNQLFAKRLMEEWWDRQPEAGPKDLPASERGGLDVPNLGCVCVAERCSNDCRLVEEQVSRSLGRFRQMASSLEGSHGALWSVSGHPVFDIPCCGFDFAAEASGQWWPGLFCGPQAPQPER